MEFNNRKGINIVYIIGICGLLAGTLSAFLLHPDQFATGTTLSQEWSEWTVVRMDPVCILLRRRNCTNYHCNSSEFRFCKDIAQWGEWASSKCMIENNACFISRVRSCSISSLKTCESNESSSDIRYWGTVETCPCRTDFATWSTWGDWNCHSEASPCVQYRHRNCSSGHDTDCQLVGGSSWMMKPCDQSCSVSTTVSTTVAITVTWTTWGNWECHTDANPCMQYRLRNCSSGQIADCVRVGGHSVMSKPCEQSCSDPITWNSWGDWNCHNEVNPCVLYRYRNCSSGLDVDCEGAEGKSYAMKPCDQSCSESTTVSTTVAITVTWNTWGNWECHTDANPCMQYRVRNCSSGHTADCEMVGGHSVTSKPCEQSCSVSSSVSPVVSWNPWGDWTCQFDAGQCVKFRHRPCSSGHDKDCEHTGEKAWDMRNIPCNETCNGPTSASIPTGK